MNCRRILIIYMSISLFLGGYRSGAQTSKTLFTKAIQLEEVKSDLEKVILHIKLTKLNKSLT
jgi:hypothetical protein